MCMLNIGPGLASKVFVMSQFIFVGGPLKIRFSMSAEKNYTFGNECKNSLIASDPAHTLFYTVMVKHSTRATGKKTDF